MKAEDREYMRGIKAEIMAGQDVIAANVQHIKETQEREFKHIEDRQNATNGRLNRVEKETRIGRLMERKPILLFLIVLGIIALIGSGGITVILKMIGL